MDPGGKALGDADMNCATIKAKLLADSAAEIPRDQACPKGTAKIAAVVDPGMYRGRY